MNDTQRHEKAERSGSIPNTESDVSTDDAERRSGADDSTPREIGGRRGPDPVRYGDWEKNGRCIDF
jgi:hypothetical protein